MDKRKIEGNLALKEKDPSSKISYPLNKELFRKQETN